MTVLMTKENTESSYTLSSHEAYFSSSKLLTPGRTVCSFTKNVIGYLESNQYINGAYTAICAHLKLPKALSQIEIIIQEFIYTHPNYTVAWCRYQPFSSISRRKSATLCKGFAQQPPFTLQMVHNSACGAVRLFSSRYLSRPRCPSRPTFRGVLSCQPRVANTQHVGFFSGHHVVQPQLGCRGTIGKPNRNSDKIM